MRSLAPTTRPADALAGRAPNAWAATPNVAPMLAACFTKSLRFTDEFSAMLCVSPRCGPVMRPSLRTCSGEGMLSYILLPLKTPWEERPPNCYFLCWEVTHTMNKTLGISLILTGALLAGGCATKKYVQQTAAPIQSKVDQVSDQSNKQGASIEEARKDIERHETGINAAKERAISAENQAKEAMTAAQKADQDAMAAQSAADKNGQQISSL